MHLETFLNLSLDYPNTVLVHKFSNAYMADGLEDTQTFQSTNLQGIGS